MSIRTCADICLLLKSILTQLLLGFQYCRNDALPIEDVCHGCNVFIVRCTITFVMMTTPGYDKAG